MEQTPQPVISPSPQLTETSSARPKKWWIIGIIAGLVVLIAGFIWWLAANQQDTYLKNAALYEQNLKDAVEYYQEAADSDDRVSAVKDKFDDALTSRPKEPSLLGMALPVPAATKERLEAITAPFTEMRNAFVEYDDFNFFAEEVLELIHDLGPAILDLQENQTVFNEAAEKLRGLKASSAATDFKNEKAKVLEAIAVLVGKAREAVDATPYNFTGYEAAVDEIDVLEAKIDRRVLVDELKGIHRKLYDSLSQKYDAAATALGVEK